MPNIIVRNEIGRIVAVRFRHGWFRKCIVQIRRERYITEDHITLSEGDIKPVTKRRSVGMTEWEDLDNHNFKDLMETMRLCNI